LRELAVGLGVLASLGGVLGAGCSAPDSSGSSGVGDAAASVGRDASTRDDDASSASETSLFSHDASSDEDVLAARSDAFVEDANFVDDAHGEVSTDNEEASATGDSSTAPDVTARGASAPDATLAVSSDAGVEPADAALADVVVEAGIVALWTGGHPASLAIDSANAYFGDPEAGTVMAVPLAGGTAALVAAGQPQWQAPGTNAGEVVAAGGKVYWAGASYVATVGPDGGAREVTPSSSTLHGFAVDSDGGNVYWESASGLAQTSIASGSTTTLTSLNGSAPPVFDGTRVVLFPGPGCDQSGVAVSPDGGVTTLVEDIPGNVYFASLYAGTIAYARQTYGSCVCASTCPPPFSSGQDWADGLGAFAVAASNTASPLNPYPFSTNVSVGAVATDGTSVYVARLGAISKVPLNGGPATTLAPAVTPAAIALDGTSLYWADPGAGAVMKVTPR
jgi:hypothetical protein